MNETILIVEDDPQLRAGLRDNLQFEGYQVLSAWNAAEGEVLWRKHQPHLTLLDVMLPGRDGFRLLRDMRQAGYDTPALMLTARGEEWDRVRGFRSGCDDYVVKPFSVLELLERIRAVLRRSGKSAAPLEALAVGDVVLDAGSHELRVGETIISLKAKECELLAYFLRSPGRVIPRAELLANVWQASPEIETRTLDAHVASLRRVLTDSSMIIETIYKVGYRLTPKILNS